MKRVICILLVLWLCSSVSSIAKAGFNPDGKAGDVILKIEPGMEFAKGNNKLFTALSYHEQAMNIFNPFLKAELCIPLSEEITFFLSFQSSMFKQTNEKTFFF
jgi:hypothetical protein